jgi:hypothetical protein
VYNNEYNIRNINTDIEEAIIEFTAPFDTNKFVGNKGLKNPVIIDKINVDNNILVYYRDEAVEGVFGFTLLWKGINGKYQIRNTNYGRTYCYVDGYPFLTSKGNYVAIGGSGYNERIANYKAWLRGSEELLSNEVDGNNFLDIYRVKDKAFPSIDVFDVNDNNITKELWNDFNGVLSRGVAKVELFMLYVFIVIILGIGFLISKFFWQIER